MHLITLVMLMQANAPVDAGVPAAALAPWRALKLDAIDATPGRSREELFETLRPAEVDVANCLRASPITLSASVTMTIEATGVVSRVDASAEVELAACLRTRFFALRFTGAAEQQTVKLNLVAAPRLLGSMDKQIIRRIVNEHAAQIRYCYEKELTRTPGLAGKIKMKWVIGGDGLVSQASVETDGMKNDAVSACLIEKIKTWKFPKPKGGGIVIVSYPFVFKQSG